MNNYIIVDARFSTELENRVNIKIQKGYNPIGGVCVAASNGSCSYSQAMVLSNNLQIKETLNI